MNDYFVSFQNDRNFWRWCRQCEGFFYWNGTSTPAPCPAGGGHVAGSSSRYMPPRLSNETAVAVDPALVSVGSTSPVPDTPLKIELLSLTNTEASLRVIT